MIVGHIGGSSSGGYEIQKSLRFRASASAYLSRTPTVAGNRRTWTWSGWVKRGSLSAAMFLFSSATDSANQFVLQFGVSGALEIVDYRGGATQASKISTALHRDTSAWYHVVLRTDTTQATAEERFRLYVNGVRLTAFSTNTVSTLQNVDIDLNQSGTPHRIGASYFGGGHLDGYLSEINFIDGQALDPSYFGEVSAETGAWIPKKYTGTYGTNGFYLPFNDGTSATTLGYDAAGSNDWSASGITTPDDWRKDSPTNNYAAYNRLIQQVAGSSVINANCVFECTLTGSEAYELLTLPTGTTGKYYVEFHVSSGTNVNTSTCEIGLVSGPRTSGTNSGRLDQCPSSTVYRADGQKGIDASFSAYGASWGANDKIGVAVNKDANEITFYKNNTSQGTITSVDTQDVFLGVCLRVTSGSGSVLLVTDDALFAYTPPTGFKALCTKNLPAPSILNPKKHFDVKTRAGTGANFTQTGIQFPPDLVWIKPRNAVDHHILTDRIRGTQKQIYSNLTLAEETETTGNLTAFTSDGYTLAGAAASVRGATNVSGQTYVDWLWKAGGAPVTNSAGSIQSQVSANPQAGFSIVTYTGTGATATVGHGLGVAPKMVIVKPRVATTTSDNWCVGHSSLTSGFGSFLVLNGADAQVTAANRWNSTNPTSSVFSLGTVLSDNTKSYVAYCFAEIPGYSKIGSYVGNGSADGPFVYCGFRPRFVMIKNTTTGGVGYDWVILDTARETYNAQALEIVANGSSAEVNGGQAYDMLSNGFKVRGTGAKVNGSGQNYIFIAFAESPFKFANAR